MMMSVEVGFLYLCQSYIHSMAHRNNNPFHILRLTIFIFLVGSSSLSGVAGIGGQPARSSTKEKKILA